MPIYVREYDSCHTPLPIAKCHQLPKAMLAAKSYENLADGCIKLQCLKTYGPTSARYIYIYK